MQSTKSIFNKFLQLFRDQFFSPASSEWDVFLDLLICFSYSAVSKSASVFVITLHTDEDRKTKNAVTSASTAHTIYCLGLFPWGRMHLNTPELKTALWIRSTAKS